MSTVKLNNISYSYNRSGNILDDLSAEFESGKMYVILGPSGCGKTTLLSLLGGLDVPTSGSISFDGKNITDDTLNEHRRSNVSFIFQNYNLIDYMTPEENVKLTAREEPVPLLERLGLSSDEIERNVLKLSGGQQQRVAIARALASHNPVILADEPTGNLDENTAQEITSILKEAAKEFDRCVIIVSHSYEVAKQADIVYELSHGKLHTLESTVSRKI